MTFVGSIILAVWMIHSMNQQIRMDKVITRAAAEASLLSDMFPLPSVRDRVIQDTRARKMGRSSEFSDDLFRDDGAGFDNLSEARLQNIMTSEAIFGSKPIAELYPYTTIMFADIAGFSAWASARDPTHVFQFLEIVYHSWDMIARRRGVFKVESVRDSYTAVAGLPKACSDHAVRIAKFATDCAHRVHVLCHALEKVLGPDTASLACRFGLHSGQVLAGVLRGEKSHFQLFGDVVHKASQIKTTCVPNKIHMSHETAKLLTEAGFGKWCIPRAGLVLLKNQNQEQTFFLQISKVSSIGEDCRRGMLTDLVGFGPDCDKTDRLIHWNVEVLSGLLCRIVARRDSFSDSSKLVEHKGHPGNKKGNNVLDEVSDILIFPEGNATSTKKQVDPKKIKLDDQVLRQLEDFCRTVASMYRNNTFHSFAHASHVVMSVVKMIGRMIDQKDQWRRTQEGESDHTFGINSDPLTQFACAFAALTHDVDHHGVPNSVLVREKDPLAIKYKNKSILEQNAVDLVWGVLMKPEFEALRDCICSGRQDEFLRFRALYVNAMMATDILDAELGAARTLRWNRAFNDGDDWVSQQEGRQVKMNRKATIVIEHLMQASDLSHTMQHWNIYLKWNENLFHELYQAFKDGRLEKDPSADWYQEELTFFDDCVIPLAKKLFTCGVFGVSSDELLNYALINRREWAEQGDAMVEQYLKNLSENNHNENECTCHSEHSG